MHMDPIKQVNRTIVADMLGAYGPHCCFDRTIIIGSHPQAGAVWWLIVVNVMALPILGLNIVGLASSNNKMHTMIAATTARTVV